MMNFDTFFRCFKSNTHSWYTSNFESANKNPSLIRVAAIFTDVILVLNYQRKDNENTTIPSAMTFARFHIKHVWLLLLLCRI